jgi:hypothetical protein
LYHYKGLSYEKFRLFLLSILWRLLICKIFGTPAIDKEEVERLRKAIYNEDPLQYDDFGCTMQAIMLTRNRLATRLILPPYSDTKEGKLVIQMLIDEFLYTYFIDSKSGSDELKFFFLKPDGSMIVLGRPLKDDTFLNDKVNTVFSIFGIDLK